MEMPFTSEQLHSLGVWRRDRWKEHLGHSLQFQMTGSKYITLVCMDCDEKLIDDNDFTELYELLELVE